MLPAKFAIGPMASNPVASFGHDYPYLTVTDRQTSKLTVTNLSIDKPRFTTCDPALPSSY
ncbi:unnamed protein product [Acidithrix sp. C25]|nr:unnamed protein product [Acidithrix sp. C25]